MLRHTFIRIFLPVKVVMTLKGTCDSTMKSFPAQLREHEESALVLEWQNLTIIVNFLRKGRTNIRPTRTRRHPSNVEFVFASVALVVPRVNYCRLCARPFFNAGPTTSMTYDRFLKFEPAKPY